MQTTDFTMRLCGCDCKVSFSSSATWKPVGMGLANSRTGGIELADDLRGSILDATFLHEMIHLILDFQGYASVSRQERVVECLSLALLAWMRDNQELVDQISHGVEVPVPA